MIDLSEMIAMARECGCYKVIDGQTIICTKCAKAIGYKENFTEM